METLLSLETEPVINIRRQTLNGREFVVADVILLKEGVLSGSKGPLFYPADEIAKNHGMWNGVPITANHPMKDGRPASAREPEMWSKYHVGVLFNDRYDPVAKIRRAEAWYDVEMANRVDNRIIPSIISGKPINVSTGLFTKDDPVQNDATHNGTKYTHIARDYRADHLATLLDDKGACSVIDGCGINVNQDHSTSTTYPLFFPEVTMNRDQLVSWLTTNCDCWKNKEEVLKNDKVFTDEDLKKLKNNAERLTLTVNTLKEVGETFGLAKNATLDDLKTHAKSMKDKADKMMDDEDDEEEDKGNKGKKMKNNKEVTANSVKEYISSLSDKERLDLIGSPTINELVKVAKETVDEKRVEIMKQLTANISDEKEKKAKLLKLKDKSLPQLKELLEFATVNAAEPPKDDNETFLANFFGAQGADPAINRKGKGGYDKNDILPPTLNVFDGEEDEEEVA